MNIARLALDNIERFGPYTSIYFEDRSFTNVALYERASQMAALLSERGINRGDRVVVMMLNSPDVMIAFLAVWKLGAVIIPVTPMWTAREVRYVLEDSAAHTIITSPELASRLKEASEGIAGFKQLLVIGETNVDGANGITTEIDSAAPLEALVECKEDDLAMLLYTSGTTGNPKGVMLSHDNLLFVADSVYENQKSLGQYRSMLVLPLSHVYGVLVMNAGLRIGTISRILRFFDPTRALETIQDFRVQRVAVVPTMLTYLINHPEREKYDTSSLELVGSGASPLSEAVRQEFQRLFNCRLIQGYGLSESAGALTSYLPDEEYRLGSVGRALAGIEVCIMDFDNKRLPPRQTGEICTRGRHVMKGYLNKAEATGEAIIDGWLHTGDIGYMDEDGYVYITDRKKDLIIKGGENISPREIEESIYAHPSVAEAAVFGVTDELYGEQVCAAIVIRPGHSITEEEIKQHISRYVTKFKVPSRIAFLESLPKNASGKILKRTLREQFASST
jgi:long-chain acyl-CoA synthetase